MKKVIFRKKVDFAFTKLTRNFGWYSKFIKLHPQSALHSDAKFFNFAKECGFETK